MPTIYRYIGFVISFFTHDHLPVHVHVEKGGRRNKFELIYRGGELNIVCKKIGNSEPLSSQEVKLVKEFLYRKHIQIVNKWNQVHIHKKTIKAENIRKKL